MTRRQGERLPVALIGFGGSGAGIHRPLITANPKLSLDVVVTRAHERMEAARRQCPDARVTEDVTAARDCAVAVVTIPPRFRAGIVEQLLDLGVHVVAEKPMAADTDEAVRLAERASYERLTVFQNRRFDSDFLTLQRLGSERMWAGPARLESRIQWWQPTVRDGWRNQPDGGGMLLEVGSHLIDQAILLLGPVTAVYAELDARRRGAVAEDDVFLALQHADGSRSHLAAGPVGNADSPRFQLTAADTFITLGAPDRQQAQLTEGLAPDAADWGTMNTSDWMIRRGAQPAASIRAERGRWPVFYDAVVEWVASSGRAPVQAEEGIAIMRVVEAARQSSRASRTVFLGEEQ